MQVGRLLLEFLLGGLMLPEQHDNGMAILRCSNCHVWAPSWPLSPDTDELKAFPRKDWLVTLMPSGRLLPRALCTAPEKPRAVLPAFAPPAREKAPTRALIGGMKLLGLPQTRPKRHQLQLFLFCLSFASCHSQGPHWFYVVGHAERYASCFWTQGINLGTCHLEGDGLRGLLR